MCKCMYTLHYYYHYYYQKSLKLEPANKTSLKVYTEASKVYSSYITHCSTIISKSPSDLQYTALIPIQCYDTVVYNIITLEISENEVP